MRPTIAAMLPAATSSTVPAAVDSTATLAASATTSAAAPAAAPPAATSAAATAVATAAIIDVIINRRLTFWETCVRPVVEHLFTILTANAPALSRALSLANVEHWLSRHWLALEGDGKGGEARLMDEI